MTVELLQPQNRIDMAGRGLRVMNAMLQVEEPMYRALAAEYGPDRGWSICGPSSIVLSRLISSRTGIPIQRNGEGERLELITRLHRRRPFKKDTDHTAILYHTGNDNAFLIDPIYPITSEGQTPGQGAIKFERYRENEIEDVLTHRYALHPFVTLEPNSPSWQDILLFTRDKSDVDEIEEIQDAMNDERALGTLYINKDNIVRPTPWWGDRVRRVLQAVNEEVPAPTLLQV